MPHYVCYYHIIWAVKYRQPLITPDLEPIILSAVRRKSAKLESPIHAVNTAYDHIHVAVTISPKVAVAKWVRQVKGLSAHEINEQYPGADNAFRWQRGYSVWTLGKKTLPYIVTYVENQKEHHANNTLEPYLETINQPE